MKKRILCLFLCGSILFSNTHALAFSNQDAIESEAEIAAENFTEITSGDFYDSVISVYPAVTITDQQDGSVSIDINITDTSDANSAAIVYLWVATRIMGKEDFLDQYNSISFSLYDKNTFSILSISDYKNLSDFTSSLICMSTDNSELSDSIKSIYQRIFYNFDRDVKSDKAFNDLAKKYGQETETISDVNNDYLWLFSSFTPGVSYDFKDNMAIINYKNLNNSYSSGYTTWEEIKQATRNYSILYSAYPELLSFYTIDVVGYLEGSDESIIQFSTEKKLDGSWENRIFNVNGEEFQEGIWAADKEG